MVDSWEREKTLDIHWIHVYISWNSYECGCKVSHFKRNFSMVFYGMCYFDLYLQRKTSSKKNTTKCICMFSEMPYQSESSLFSLNNVELVGFLLLAYSQILYIRNIIKKKIVISDWLVPCGIYVWNIIF